MIINIFNETDFELESYFKLLSDVFKTIDNDYEMQIIFVNHDKMQELNKTYRHIDRSTDVLSFENDYEIDGSIGDIFINYEQAIVQAEEYQHSVNREIAFLAVHGYLHLMGYDHETKEEEKEMFLLQETILANAGLKRS